jgi:hypothetical protein
MLYLCKKLNYMGTITDWIEDSYQHYRKLCFIFEVRAIDISDDRWVDHYRTLKEAYNQ